MKAWILFVALSVTLMGVAGWILGVNYESAAEHRTIWVSAAVAVSVQLVTFAIARRAAPRNVIVGWGIGALVRFATLAIYALVVVEALGLASSVALISLATFLFLSLLVESFLVSA